MRAEMIKAGAKAKLKTTGEAVVVLSADSDESCAAWVIFAADCNRDAMVARADLVLA